MENHQIIILFACQGETIIFLNFSRNFFILNTATPLHQAKCGIWCFFSTSLSLSFSFSLALITFRWIQIIVCGYYEFWRKRETRVQNMKAIFISIVLWLYSIYDRWCEWTKNKLAKNWKKEVIYILCLFSRISTVYFPFKKNNRFLFCWKLPLDRYTTQQCCKNAQAFKRSDNMDWFPTCWFFVNSFIDAFSNQNKL